MTEVAQAAPESPFWPVWRHDDLAGIAEFASRHTLALTDLLPEQRPAGDERAVAAELYGRLRTAQVKYRREPEIWQRGQRFRHARWMLEEGGNCLDLTAVYAAMCMEMEIAPLIAVTRSHAFVMFEPGRVRAAPIDLDTLNPMPFGLPGSEAVEDGVVRVTDSEGLLDRIAAGRLVAVDCTAACSGAGFEAAEARALEHVRPGIFVVDVLWLQMYGGRAEREEPDGWPTVRPYPPRGLSVPAELYPNQAAAATRLAAAVGTAVIHADSGLGKSVLARHVARGASYDAGWFLTASDRESLIDSLADAEQHELGVVRESLERADREGLAQAALRRLRESRFPWTVVLDNADGPIPAIERYLPRPNPARGQLLLVTTTNADWLGRSGAQPVQLDSTDPGDVQKRLGTADLNEAIGGRALLITAFERLLSDQPVDPAGIVAGRSFGDELDGPTAFWDAVKTLPWMDDATLRAAATAALMPPDHIPSELLERLAQAPAGTAARLTALGLLDARGEGEVALHRLLGRAVRTDLEHADPERLQQAALRVASDEQALEVVNRHGDLGGVVYLHERVRDVEHADDELRWALRGVGQMFELRGATDRSTEAYRELEPLLDEDDPSPRPLIAEALHSRARESYRNHKDDPKRLQAALGQARRAFEIASAEMGDVKAGRFLAMQGLIQKELASSPTAAETEAELLAEAGRVLQRAHELRSALPEDHPERVRSQYNLAGLWLRLAQVEPAMTVEHLARADGIYDEVAGRRHRIFGTAVHPQIAPCIQGQGMVAYYRALLVAGTAEERSRWLRDATGLVTAALDQWHEIEYGGDATECKKATRLLAKIALARHVHQLAVRQRVDFAKLHRDIATLAVEVVEELRGEQARRGA